MLKCNTNTNFIKGANAYIEVEQKTIIPETISDYCEPEFTITTRKVWLSLEQDRNSVESEQKGLADDVLPLRGRCVSPRNWSFGVNQQKEYKMSLISSPGVISTGRCRILPEASSRMGLERIFGSHIQLLFEVDA